MDGQNQVRNCSLGYLLRLPFFLKRLGIETYLLIIKIFYVNFIYISTSIAERIQKIYVDIQENWVTTIINCMLISILDKI